MNKTQISPSVETHTEEPLWQELTEQEQEKIAGGMGHRVTYGNWQLTQRNFEQRQVIYSRFGLMYNWRVQSRYWHNNKWHYSWSGNRQRM